MEEYVYSVKFIKSFRPFYNKKVPEIQKFLELYQDIEKKDFIKPIYSETNKYNSFPSFTYNKKYSKKGGSGGSKKKGVTFLKKGSNAWQPYTPSSNGEKIKQIVISNFNKLTNKNFEQVSDQLIQGLSGIDCSDVLTILGNEVLKKLMYDKNFYKVYVDLCKKIWKLDKWHDSLVTVMQDDGVLYWCENKINVDENMKIYGPYESLDDLRKASRSEINFKRYLMNMLYSEYCKMDEYLEKMQKAVKDGDEDDEFKYRRKIFSNGEFVAELYKDGNMSEKIINIYFVYLLCMKDFDEKSVNNIKLEVFSKMWSIIGGKIRCRSDIITHVNERILKMNLENRIKFMMQDVIGRKKNDKAKVIENVWQKKGGKDSIDKNSRDKNGRDKKNGNKYGSDNRFSGNVWNRFGNVGNVSNTGGIYGKNDTSNKIDGKSKTVVSYDDFYEESEEKLNSFLCNYDKGKSADYIKDEKRSLVKHFLKCCTNMDMGKVLLEVLFNRALENDVSIDRITPIVSVLLREKVLRRKYIGGVFKELDNNLDDIALDIPDVKKNFERLRNTKF